MIFSKIGLLKKIQILKAMEKTMKLNAINLKKQHNIHLTSARTVEIWLQF